MLSRSLGNIYFLICKISIGLHLRASSTTILHSQWRMKYSPFPLLSPPLQGKLMCIFVKQPELLGAWFQSVIPMDHLLKQWGQIKDQGHPDTIEGAILPSFSHPWGLGLRKLTPRGLVRASFGEGKTKAGRKLLSDEMELGLKPRSACLQSYYTLIVCYN